VQGSSCTQHCSIIQEAQRGNPTAFEELIHAHDQSVLRLALRITGSQIDAQDIYQETFLKAFKKLAGFRFECAFSTWIYRIATNACLDHLRKKNNRRETSAAEVNVDGEEYDLLNQFPDDRAVSNPEREVLRREISAHISRALTRLTPQEQIIFEFKHYQGLNLRTLSGILNCSEATIKTTLFRARQKLRVHLAGFYLGKIVQRGAH
jgi:RNA polymerase sigma-70 factor (ECF subfamily)